MSIEIRKATVDDAADVARIHIHSWQETYRGMMPQAYLDSLDLERRITNWTMHLQNPDAFEVNIATVGGKAYGIAAAGKCRDKDLDYQGEIFLIYVLQEAKGKGLGRMLMRAMKETMLRQGIHNAALWVLDVNPARRFYEHMGAKQLQSKEVELAGTTLVEVAYGFDNFDVY
ncbi:hypothetical protein VHEMI00815 [[Torrubiella] hemipterigena]|uniref:N-acetyltransferase domain-containing protein n=1 Tax=[Torrubiella] hemipterigena TaxID=1531966 RepID=A0A0A1T5R1_9HYPO|nr:hypothetical protein VHEMI00815 [[Torrubiella] hemipterigena]